MPTNNFSQCAPLDFRSSAAAPPPLFYIIQNTLLPIYECVWFHPLEEHGQPTHGPSPLKKNGSPSPSSHQLPVAAQLGIGPQEHILLRC